VPLPWSPALAAEFAKDFGADPFPYGIEANRTTLDAFCRFAHDQGITSRRMTPEDLFPPEMHKTARV
jgi:4,5-dihydroxyphthalate decarboxylase